MFIEPANKNHLFFLRNIIGEVLVWNDESFWKKLLFVTFYNIYIIWELFIINIMIVIKCPDQYEYLNPQGHDN